MRDDMSRSLFANAARPAPIMPISARQAALEVDATTQEEEVDATTQEEEAVANPSAEANSLAVPTPTTKWPKAPKTKLKPDTPPQEDPVAAFKRALGPLDDLQQLETVLADRFTDDELSRIHHATFQVTRDPALM